MAELLRRNDEPCEQKQEILISLLDQLATLGPAGVRVLSDYMIDCCVGLDATKRIGEMGRVARSAAPKLVKLLGEDSAQLGAVHYEALGRVAGDQVRVVLLLIEQSERTDLRGAWALGSLGWCRALRPRVVAQIKRALQGVNALPLPLSRVDYARLERVLSAVAAQGTAATSVIRDVSQSLGRYGHRSAALALASIGTPEAALALNRALDSDREVVVLSALAGIQNWRGERAPVFWDGLTRLLAESPSARVRWNSAIAVKDRGKYPATVAESLVLALTDSSAIVRRYAVQALAVSETTSASMVSALIEAESGDPAAPVREEARRVLRLWGHRAR
jgi:HEAT repeat protein